MDATLTKILAKFEIFLMKYWMTYWQKYYSVFTSNFPQHGTFQISASVDHSDLW